MGACLLATVFLSAAVPWGAVYAGSDCRVAHPLNPPDDRYTGRCPNCGMTRSRWARTWVSFENPEGEYSVCSLHCLADISRKSGHVPERVQVALYLSPQVMMPATAAAFVVGSRARGTMTKTSKLAFADRSSAAAFADACGGKATTWFEAYSMALAGLGEENAAVDAARRQKGKIVPPRDRVDECALCGMYPARYPRHRAQILTRQGKIVHFCSTQCLFTYLKDPQCFGGSGKVPCMIWVTDYASGRWISGRTAYYAVHSREWGPMGHEAFAFDVRSAARTFVEKNGGEVLPFERVRIEEIFSPR